MAESVAVMEDLRSLILDTKKSEKERHKLLFSSSVLVLSVVSAWSSSLTVRQRLADDWCALEDSFVWKNCCLDDCISLFAVRQACRYARRSCSDPVERHFRSKRRRTRLAATASGDSHSVSGFGGRRRPWRSGAITSSCWDTTRTRLDTPWGVALGATPQGMSSLCQWI